MPHRPPITTLSHTPHACEDELSVEDLSTLAFQCEQRAYNVLVLIRRLSTAGQADTDDYYCFAGLAALLDPVCADLSTLHDQLHTRATAQEGQR